MKEYIAKESKIRNSVGNIDYGYLDFQIHKNVEDMIISAEQDAYKQGRKSALNEFINKVVSHRIYDNDLNLADLEMVKNEMLAEME